MLVYDAMKTACRLLGTMHQVLSRAESSTNQRQSQPALKESASVINHQPTSGRFLSYIFEFHLFSFDNMIELYAVSIFNLHFPDRRLPSERSRDSTLKSATIPSGYIAYLTFSPFTSYSTLHNL